jgi:hypothetical protein
MRNDTRGQVIQSMQFDIIAAITIVVIERISTKSLTDARSLMVGMGGEGT